MIVDVIYLTFLISSCSSRVEEIRQLRFDLLKIYVERSSQWFIIFRIVVEIRVGQCSELNVQDI